MELKGVSTILKVTVRGLLVFSPITRERAIYSYVCSPHCTPDVLTTLCNPVLDVVTRVQD